MSTTKRFVNNNNNNNTRVQNKGENWTEQGQYQQRKHGKYPAKYQNKTGSYMSYTKMNEDGMVGYAAYQSSAQMSPASPHDSSAATVPMLKTNVVPAVPTSSCVPSLSVEHSINESPDDSMHEPTDEAVCASESKEETIVEQFDQQPGHYVMVQPQMAPPQQPSNESYVQNGYDYEYAGHMMQPAAPQSQYYVYHSYPAEYPNVQNSPVSAAANITGTPQQSAATYYTAYPTSYLYDPNTGYTYSPVQQPPQQAPVLSSPPSSTMLASYQTPPQPQHQLYMTPSTMSPPHSMSPNDNNTLSTNSSSTTLANERSNCNSPQVSSGLMHQTPANNNSPYMMYPGSNPYLTPQPYQSPMPAQFMMYPPPQVPSYMPQPPASLPTSQTSPMITPPYNNNNNRFNKNRRFNNYKQRNQRFNYIDQSPSSYSPECCNSPVAGGQQQAPTYEEGGEEPLEQYPGTAYCENLLMGLPGMPSLPGVPNNEQMAYEYDAGIQSYGDDYDYDEENADADDGQLACQICRGRRMCFCYFLKVRYYKFPSFFDLVDHQYKKWRSSMVKAKKAA